MIACLIAVQFIAMTEFRQVEFPTTDLAEAERFAAMDAGRLTAGHPPGSESRFGFRCGDGSWVAVGLDHADLFGRARRHADAR